ncbi:MAG: iron-sulfur cluster repair di-iron protein [Candidatus Obscuribacterales bacterium]|nr:iron-sulfur cluster repair di-iron protein [Candidatus Obscuribacterales bacterium]
MSTAKTICTVCNYIYDEALGEPRLEISPELKFEDLPDEWPCPECGSAKDMFQPCSCVSLPIYEQTCALHQQDTNPNHTLAATAESSISKATSVGQLVAQRPLRACVLEQYGIDYCCGGKATLEEACRKKGLEVEEILEKLLAADRKTVQSFDTDWTTASLKDLIDHIVSTYHQPLRQELSRVAQLAEKVARVHGDNHPEMVEVMNIFNRFKAQLELHMQKEEMVLFPGIASMEATGTPQIFGCGGGIEHPIDVMNQEHDEAGEALCAMRRLTHDYTPPEDACSSFKVLLSSLALIESEMHQHVHKENNILFPRALELRNPALISR